MTIFYRNGFLDGVPMKNKYYKDWGSTEYTSDGYVINRNKQGKEIERKRGNSNTSLYVVQKGDTLSKISKLYTSNLKNYDVLAFMNNIKDPNKIKVGQVLKIPEIYGKPLKLKDIPTKNKIHIIDNYSPNYNYIVEDAKIYSSLKGHDSWKDISNNNIARKNLYNFIGDKYNFPFENITTHTKIRDMYNDYAKKQGIKLAPHKPDITEKDYNRILNELLRTIYYKK